VDATSCDTCPAPSLTRRRLLAAGSCGIVAWLAGLRWAEAEGMPVGNGQERTYPIPAADGVTIDREAQVILVRQQQEVYAFNLSCPHQNAAVRWNEAGQRFQCSRHDSRYTADGTHTSGRATRNMDRFPIHRTGATVVVDVSRILRSDQDAAAWVAAHVSLA
jgi:nitrite reductase/ring-hydroxylating ferredoxin subunit